MILTDGGSNCGSYQANLKNLKDIGVNIISIGVGSGIDYEELSDYATASNMVY